MLIGITDSRCRSLFRNDLHLVQVSTRTLDLQGSKRLAPFQVQQIAVQEPRGSLSRLLDDQFRATCRSTLASLTMLSILQYSFGWCAMSSRVDQTAVCMPLRLKYNPTVPPPIPTAFASMPRSFLSAVFNFTTTSLSVGVGEVFSSYCVLATSIFAPDSFSTFVLRASTSFMTSVNGYCGRTRQSKY